MRLSWFVVNVRLCFPLATTGRPHSGHFGLSASGISLKSLLLACRANSSINSTRATDSSSSTAFSISVRVAVGFSSRHSCTAFRMRRTKSSQSASHSLIWLSILLSSFPHCLINKSFAHPSNKGAFRFGVKRSIRENWGYGRKTDPQ